MRKIIDLGILYKIQLINALIKHYSLLPFYFSTFLQSLELGVEDTIYILVFVTFGGDSLSESELSHA